LSDHQTRQLNRAIPADFAYIADLDYWQRTHRERVVYATSPFDLVHDLNTLPLQIGDWQGRDVPETNIEVFILLEPEQFVQRFYQDSQGHRLWLTLIGSRKSRSFHPPDLCYVADGWQVALSSQAVPLPRGGNLYGLWLNAHKQFPENPELTERRAFYFYIFPNAERKQADGLVLFKLTTPFYNSLEETLTIQQSFLQHIFQQSLVGDQT
jgi:hypothetical protein